MKPLYKIPLIISIIFTTNLSHTKIIESNLLDNVLKIVNKGDLVVFDIDNTISNPKTYTGSSPWFDKKVKKLLKKALVTTMQQL